MSKVSVCIATYNGAAFIEQQVKSILSQLGENDEVIVSDDGSTDTTLDIISSFNDHRINIFHHKPNPNYCLPIIKNMNLASNNFANAISICSGDIIILSDQDDIWIDNKVRVIKEVLENECDLCLHNFSIVDQYNKLLISDFRKRSPLCNNYFKNCMALPFTGCCMAFNRSVKNILFPFSKYIVSHDQYIGLKALRHGFRVKYLDLPLIRRREHISNASLYRNPTLMEKIRYNYLLYKSIFKYNIIRK